MEENEQMPKWLEEPSDYLQPISVGSLNAVWKEQHQRWPSRSPSYIVSHYSRIYTRFTLITLLRSMPMSHPTSFHMKSLTCALTRERWWRPGQAPCPHWWCNSGTYCTFRWWGRTLLNTSFKLVHRELTQSPHHLCPQKVLYSFGLMHSWVWGWGAGKHSLLSK